MDFFKSKQSIKIPNGFKDHKKMRDYLKEFIKIKSLVKVGWSLGLGNPIDIFNKVLGYYYPEGNPEAQKGDDKVDISYTEYLGVPVKLYIPKHTTSSSNRTGMVFYHGGGYCLGSADEMDPLTRRISTDCSMVIASIKLAPDHIYPAAIDDCMTATKYFFSICNEQYGVDPDRVIIAGDSSGGHLAACVSSRLSRDQFKPKPRLQVLIYPMLQMIDLNTPSYVANKDDPYLCRWLIAIFIMSYVVGRDVTMRHVTLAMENHHAAKETLKRYRYITGGAKCGGDSESKADSQLVRMCEPINGVDLNPLLEEDFSILPDTYIIKCTQDVLASETDSYAAKVRETGNVTVVVKEYVALHAMLDYPDLEVAERAVVDLIEYINTL